MNEKDFKFISRQRFNMYDKIRKLMTSGVRFVDPNNVYIGPDVKIGKGTLIWPGTYLLGETHIGENCEIGPCVKIENSKIGDCCHIGFQTDICDSIINSRAEVAHCEIVRSFIGKRTKIKHCSYIGDATIYRDCNIGAHAVFGNYDGKAKHRVVVMPGVFIGIHTSIISSKARVIGEQAMIGAKTLIKEEVDPGVVVVRKVSPLEVVGLSKRTKDGWETSKLS